MGTRRCVRSPRDYAEFSGPLATMCYPFDHVPRLCPLTSGRPSKYVCRFIASVQRAEWVTININNIRYLVSYLMRWVAEGVASTLRTGMQTVAGGRVREQASS